MEEVLGFKKKDASDYLSGGHGWSVSKDKLVPVRLKSESVSIEEHEAKIKELENRIKQLRDLVSFVAKGGKPSDWLMQDFPIDAVKEQAGKKQEKSK